MKIEKSFEISAPREQVWEFISAPEKVGMCFPGCQLVTPLGDDRYEATIKVQLGPIRTVFNINFENTGERPLEFLSYTSRGEEGHRASRLKADSTLTLSAAGPGKTRVIYTSDLSLVGRLGKFGQAMMKKKADAMGEEFVHAVREQIETPGTVAMGLREPPSRSRFRRPQAVIVIALSVALACLAFWFITR